MSRFMKTDALFRKVLLKERPELCEHCRKRDGRMVYVAHILPKGAYPRLRYQRSNVLMLCFWCHNQWAHKNPLEFNEWVEVYKGKDLLNSLRALERGLPKVDLKMVVFCLKRDLEDATGVQYPLNRTKRAI